MSRLVDGEEGILTLVKFRYIPVWIVSALSIASACERGPADGVESSPAPPMENFPGPEVSPPADENNSPHTVSDLVPTERGGVESVTTTRRISASSILGRTRRDLETQVGPANAAQEEWAHYDAGGGFDVQFLGNEGRASRVRYVLTENRCMEAARAIGFEGAGPPLRRRERCEWPGQSRRHRLGPGVSGRLLFDMGVFEVWPR